jgi:branched-chain amino acid transport system ATP-binding protein
MLEISDLHVAYGRVDALRGVSLTVHQGEAVGLIGSNGAGKTTTLAAVTGTVPVRTGDLRFEGTSILRRRPEDIVRLGIALVPEGRRILASLTVAENLQLGSTPRRDRAGAKGDLERVLARFPVLERYYRSPAGRLSGGEQQQLAIARALLARPRLLLLDEPSLGLAPLLIDRVFEILDDLRRDGATILLVEQNAVRTAAFADRTYVLRSGTIAFSGTRDEISAGIDFASLYLGADR